MTPPAHRRRLSPDEARILERFKRLAPQRDALSVALAPFRDGDEAFDRRAWARAFSSDDPQTIVAVTAVTGIFEGLVNHLMEMLHVAARLAGLRLSGSGDKPTGPALIQAVKEDDGLQKTLGRFAKSYIEWLERHDVQLLPPRR